MSSRHPLSTACLILFCIDFTLGQICPHGIKVTVNFRTTCSPPSQQQGRECVGRVSGLTLTGFEKEHGLTRNEPLFSSMINFLWLKTHVEIADGMNNRFLLPLRQQATSEGKWAHFTGPGFLGQKPRWQLSDSACRLRLSPQAF